MSNAIELAHIAKVYRIPTILPWKRALRVEALRDVSFHAPRQKISCLLGPNGAGKTTIIKILAGLVEPDGGEASILELPLSELARDNRRRIGVLTSNDRSFYWRLTGRQNLDFFASLHGLKGKERRRHVVEVLAEVGLTEDADKPFRLYSSGMKQKLLMARALLNRPEVLLLDEPTSHLDPRAQAGMHRFIQDQLIQTRKASVLLCTNDLSEAEKLADHLILINHGRVLAEGSLSSLRSRMRSFTHLTLTFQKMPAKNWHHRIGVRISSQRGRRMEIQLRNKGQVPEILQEAVRQGGKLLECRIGEPSLAEIFERTTKAEE